MKIKYIIQDMAHFNADQLLKVFPGNCTIEQNDKTYLTVELPSGSNEYDSFFFLQREVDRLFFVTGARIKYDLISIENNDGSFTGFSDLKMMLQAVKQLPENIERQQWDANDITVHLRLWTLAFSPDIPLAAKINLLFQIIETEHPDTNNNAVYPIYHDSTNPPDPKTEAKLLRHLMSHGKAPVTQNSLRQYCTFLGIPHEMHNPVDRSFISSIKKRLPVLINEARKIIDSKISGI
ncbi:hypothetical protein [Desulfobacula sp.]|uniref:hypothetical protein n=1 Tax=Desulfobacula sp. TaxID=2593537 RepID=UPI0025B81B8A|nr:hypothetical protein [Desulfobacula sp.]MBC2703570.1 hypothetical protein [Desulfobacula sp.]